MSSPSPQLVGTYEIRLRLGVSRQRVYQLTAYSHFPKPIAELEQGKVWRAEDIEAWIVAHRKKANQPKAKPPASG